MSVKFRETLYLIGAIVPALLGLIVLYGGITQGAADNFAQVVTGLITMMGATAPATAAVMTRKQVKEGVLDASPMETVITGVTQVVEAQKKADDEIERVKAILQEAVGGMPVLGPIASDIVDDIPTLSEAVEQVQGSLTAQILGR